MTITSAVRIVLNEPVIASLGKATAAVPSSLPFLPGAMLWGILANEAYAGGKPASDILAQLYGGGLLVGDGLPVAAGSVALPAPRSLHRLKGGSVWEDWSDGQHKPGYEQSKERHIAPGGSQVNVRMVDTQRTAIDPTTLRAADGQFFGLQAIAPEQSFIALLEGAQSVVADALNILCGDHYLGRSRLAEFGQVTIEHSDVPILPNHGNDQATFLWCLSDLAPHNEYLLPTERPHDEFFGAAIDWSRCFVRHRRYSPFNQKWKAQQPERLVIARGSVLVLKSPVSAGLRRFGYFQEQGLGLVLASAEQPLKLIESWQVESDGHSPSDLQNKSINRKIEPPETDLSRWLSKRAVELSATRSRRVAAENAWNIWGPRYETAETIMGARCGPTPTQWSLIANFTTLDDLRQELENARDAQTEKESQSWQARFEAKEAGTFAAAALAILDTEGVENLRRLAKELRNALRREGWFDGH